MKRWATWQRQFGYSALVALVIAMALPAVRARAADDPATAAQAQLPPGYTVTYTQVVDLGGDGQMQAIVKAESTAGPTPLPAQIVGVLVQQGGQWQFRIETTPFANSGTSADIYVYPKNSQHSGFIIINQHICGANCNGGTYHLFLYDGSSNLPEVIAGANDRGDLSADPDTNTVTLTGPVYAHADARCCPQYRYTRTWMWQGSNLMQSDLTFAPAPDKTVPAWFTRDGATLVTALDGFVAEPAVGNPVTVAYIAPVFAAMVAVKDAANNTCMASGGVVAQAVAAGIAPGSGAIWPTEDGYNVSVRWNTQSTPDGVAADTCTLDAGANGGYILHITRTDSGFKGDTLTATPQIAEATPADAIQLPPV